MKDLLNFILEGLFPEKNFEIDESADGERVSYTIKVPQESVGLIIGKGGHMIKAIRNILKVRATLEKKAVMVNVEG